MIIRRRLLRILLGAALVATVPACGGSGGEGIAAVKIPTFDISGGDASGSASPAKTFAGNAGNLDINSCGDLRFGVNPPPTPPVLPAVPTTGTTVTSADLTGGTYILLSGNILIPGSVRSGDTTSPIMAITAMSGDIVLSGSFQSGKHTGISPAQPRSLFLSAPNGTVYVTGSITTFSDDGIPSGNSSGEVNISAQTIVVTGTIDTHGEDGEPVGLAKPGGFGGAVTLDTTAGGGTDILMVGASITTTGGGSTSAGGPVGNIFLRAGGALHLHGSIIARGGPVATRVDNVTAERGGQLQTTSTTGIFVNAAIDLSGGDAISSGGGVTAGRGGDVFVTQPNTGPAAFYGSMSLRGGNATALDPRSLVTTAGAGGTVQIGQGGATSNPSVVDLALAMLAGRGGSSPDTGGTGANFQLGCMGADPGAIIFDGEVDSSGGPGGNEGGSSIGLGLQTAHGDITIKGNLVFRGGDSGDSAGSGDGLTADCGGGAPSPTGNVFFSATFDGRGGQGTSGNANGGGGGSLNLRTRGPGNSVTVDSGSLFLLAGGASSGTGLAGRGGFFACNSNSGPVGIAGVVQAQGGPAPGAGGTGGLGGQIDVHTDLNSDGVGGDITIAAGTIIDASGGDGTIGGHARNTTSRAFTLDADGNDSNDLANNGTIRNFGTLIARGAAAGGLGGEALFDGLNPSGVVGPNPFETGGSLDLRSDIGLSGTFTPQ
jgi:hypothetical protein